MTGAIIIVGPEITGTSVSARSDHSVRSAEQLQRGIPLTCVEVLGRSVLDRLSDELRKIGIDAVTVVADRCFEAARSDVDQAISLPISWVEDAWSSATRMLMHYRENGIDTALVIRPGAYAELDYADVLQYHREGNQGTTRAYSEDVPLDIWVVDGNRFSAGEQIRDTFLAGNGARYAVGGYVNHLEHPRDLRRLVTDALSSRCRLRPQGCETRPGVWMNEGAEVHRSARIVAPAFIGRDSRIEEQCLITRCSSVESNCQIDYGTVIEDSSILPNSYVGIGLDISHSIIRGNSLLNLERDVTLEIADPGVMRLNRVLRKEANRQSPMSLGLVEMSLASVEKDVR